MFKLKLDLANKQKCQILFFWTLSIAYSSIWVHFISYIYVEEKKSRLECQKGFKKIERVPLQLCNPVMAQYDIFLLDPVVVTYCCCRTLPSPKGFLCYLCRSIPTTAQRRQYPVNCFFNQFWRQSAPMGLWASTWWLWGRFLSLWMVTTPLNLVWSAELT